MTNLGYVSIAKYHTFVLHHMSFLLIYMLPLVYQTDDVIVSKELTHASQVFHMNESTHSLNGTLYFFLIIFMYNVFNRTVDPIL